MATNKPKKQQNGTYVKRFRYKNALGDWRDGYVSAKKASDCEAKYIRFMADLDARADIRVSRSNNYMSSISSPPRYL